MEQVGIVDAVAKVFEGAILRTSKKRDEAPGLLEMQVFRRRASKLALEFKERLKHPATNPDHVEADIRVRVSVTGCENNFTDEQWDEMLKIIMDESGMTALKEQRLRRAARRIG